MKKTLLSFIMLMCASPSVVLADKNTYAGFDIGVTLTNDSDNNNVNVSFDNAANFAGMIGYRENENIRGEIELSYRDVNVKDVTAFGSTVSIDGKLATATILLNAFYDFTINEPIKPYLSVGVGTSMHNIEVEYFSSENDTVFTYQLGAGFSYDWNDTSALTIGYRYLDGEDLNFGGDQDFEYSSHEIRSGIRFYF